MDRDNFSLAYGPNANLARQIVDKAISDWHKIVTSFNYVDRDANGVFGGNMFSIEIYALSLSEQLGTTDINGIRRDGKPHSALIYLDDAGGANSWRFTLNDSFFTDLQTPFAARTLLNFGLFGSGEDFYTVVAHEIGHALGLQVDEVHNGDHLLRLAIDKVEKTPIFSEYIRPLPDQDDQDSSMLFYEIVPGGLGITMSDSHLYDRHHPLDLMNRYPTQATSHGSFHYLARRLISDTDAELLRLVYDYSVRLPSYTNTLYASLESGGTLVVRGLMGESTDTITLVSANDSVYVYANGTREQLNNATVHSIDIYAGHGNDVVDARASTRRVTIYGGLGNDTLFGGVEVDTIFGGSGFDSQDLALVALGGQDNDKIYGGAAGDQLFGGVGDDILNGEAGRDYLYGGMGSDTLHGGQDSDIDLLEGGTGADYFFPIDTFDIVIDQSDEDFPFGSRGRDRTRR